MENDKNTLCILYSSDDNYAQHLGVSIQSLLENNREFSRIRIFIIDNQISDKNCNKLKTVVDAFPNGELIFIQFSQWKEQLKLNLAWEISLSAYARLFVASMLPEELGRVIYLDCDMLICSSLRDLWNTDLKENVLGAVQDSVNDSTKNAVGLREEEKYFNSGMLLINLKEWRACGVEKQCLDMITSHHGRVIHHDQGVLNGVLHEKCLFLPLQYNVMTIHYMFSPQKIEKYFGDKAFSYNGVEIQKAKENPVILHFTPSFTSRPWVKDCKHPLRGLYWDVLRRTPWSDAEQQKNHAKWYVKLIEWRYRNLPY